MAATPKRATRGKKRSQAARARSRRGKKDGSGDPARHEAQPEQIAIFNLLGPSIGIELRGILEDSDPRSMYPRIYEVIFGKAWPVEPGPTALTKTHLRQMARDVRAAVKRLHPSLLDRVRDLEPEIRASELETVTQYRLWLAVRFLVERKGHSEAVAAFRQSARRLLSLSHRKKMVDAVERLRRVMVEPPRNSPRVILPKIAFGWPPELRQLANSVAQLQDMDGIVQRHIESAEVRLICEEQPAGQSTVRDPVAHVAIRAVDRVLELDPKGLTARARRQLIGKILDAVYPMEYRSDAHPFGPQDPQGNWSERTIRQHVDTPTAMEEISQAPD